MLFEKMAVQSLTRETLDQAVTSHAVLVIEVCSGSASPALREAAAGEERAHFAHIDSASEPATAALFGLGEEPALLIFRDRVVLYLKSGPHAGEQIKQQLMQVLALDMNQIREKLEQERRAQAALAMRRVCPTARRSRF